MAKVQLIKDAIVRAAGTRVVESDLHDEGSCVLAVMCTLLFVLALLVGFFIGKCTRDYSHKKQILMSGKKSAAKFVDAIKEPKPERSEPLRNVDTPPSSESQESEDSSEHDWYIRRRIIPDTGVAPPLVTMRSAGLNNGFQATRAPHGEKFIYLVDRTKGVAPHYHFVVKCAGLNNASNPVHKYWACDVCCRDRSPWQEEVKIVVAAPYSQFEYHNDELCTKLLAERRLMARTGYSNACPLPPISRIKNCKTCLNHVQGSTVA